MAEYASEVISTSPLYAYSLEVVDGLLESLESRAVIAQASGLMMAIERITNSEALDRLRSLAMASGESMRTVAERVIAERPPGPLPAEVELVALSDDA